MGLLSNLRAMVAALAVVVTLSAGWYTHVKILGVTRQRLEQQIQAKDHLVVSLERAVSDRDASISRMKDAIDKQNVAVSESEKLRIGIEAKRRALEVQLYNERKAWAQQEAELGKPLPSGCEDKIRETVRRLQAMMRSVK